MTHITMLLNFIVLLLWIVLNYYLKTCLLGIVVRMAACLSGRAHSGE